MKRFIFILTVLLVLTGCYSEHSSVEDGLSLRQRLMEGNGCEFQADITADFGEMKYRFTLQCQAELDGRLSFTVLSPESIADISGCIDQNSGKLTFDETVLTFPHLAEGSLSPVTGPWLFYKAMRSGYLRWSGEENGQTRISIDDSYQGENLSVEIWMEEEVPICAEILWQGRNVLTLIISDFRIL